MIGYAAQLLPWIPVSRITFAYHYFPSVIFLVLALSYTANEFLEKAPKRGIILMACAGLPYSFLYCFIPFSPALLSRAGSLSSSWDGSRHAL